MVEYIIDFGGCYVPGLRPKDIPESHTDNIKEYLLVKIMKDNYRLYYSVSK